MTRSTRTVETGPGHQGNVADLVAAAADRGEHPAFFDPDGTTVGWAQMESRVAALAGGLRAAGVGLHDRVGVMLPNGSDFAVAYWGALRAGATVVPINPAYTPRERTHIVSDSGASVVLTDAAGADAGQTDVPLLDVAAVRGTAIDTPQTGGGDCAVICYTSGTTGRPKGARLTHANLLANLEAFANLPGLTLHDDDVLLGLLPFFHVFGLNVVLNAAALHGCAIAVVSRFHPRTTAALLAERRVSIAYGAPPVFAALSALPSALRLRSLRAAISGADALPVATWQRFAERFGIEILEGYGLTETAPVLASAAAADRVKPGTVGLPLPGVDLQLLDPAGGPVATGEVGEITARGPNVFAGYHGRPEETAEVLRDGWFATGDLGAFDADGHLRIAGRLKDLIIVSGFNVYPREVEEVLVEHPGIAEAAVVGLPDERTGERVRAVVVPVPGAQLDVDEVLDHARERLARYKLPRDIQVADALPRLPTGKLARGTLRTGNAENSRNPGPHGRPQQA